MGQLNKESIGCSTSITPGNVVTSNACSNNLITPMNSSGRTNTSITNNKRKLDEMDNKSDVKKVFYYCVLILFLWLKSLLIHNKEAKLYSKV